MSWVLGVGGCAGSSDDSKGDGSSGAMSGPDTGDVGAGGEATGPDGQAYCTSSNECACPPTDEGKTFCSGCGAGYTCANGRVHRFLDGACGIGSAACHPADAGGGGAMDATGQLNRDQRFFGISTQ